MFRHKLTTKVLVAVGLTVAVVIAIYSYFVIRVQSAWWHERIQAQNLIAATLIHEYLNGVMLSDRHEEMQGFLAKMKASDEIWRGRLIKPDGQIIFSTDTQEVQRATLPVPPELFTGNNVLQGTRTEKDERLSVVMRPVLAGPSCQRCHQQGRGAIGAIVVEKSLQPAEASVASNRNLLIVYGVVIFALVGAVLWLLIVRLVSQPVSNLVTDMQRVQRGDLGARAAVESQDEIGELAQGFNSMVISLETTTDELHTSYEQQMQQAGKLASIGELAAGIAHEIRNPLAGIGAAVEVLADTHARPGEKEIVDEIHAQIHRLNTTLCDLLDFARTREPEITPCAVPELIRPMLSLIRPDAQKGHVTIVENIPAELPFVRVDLRLVQQALLNVLLNGVQAMPAGGTLTVAVTASDPTVKIRISDTGAGISAEQREKIFTPFFTTKHRGTGLGLAITRSIIEKHQGRITVESEPGRGATFIIELTAAGDSALKEAKP
jgi:signal transduction histidine kinase